MKYSLHHIITTLKKRLSGLAHPFIYVAMGDSTAEGMGASIPERSYTHIVFASIKVQKKRAKFYNISRGGSILKDVLNTQLPKAIALQPDLITLSVGANDMIRRTKQKEFEEEYHELVDQLLKKTKATIVICTVPDLSLAPAIPTMLKTYSRYMAGRLNKIIHSAGKNDRIIIIDILNFSKEVIKAYPEVLSSDGFHPSDFGYALWANTILHHINPWLAKKS